MLSLYSLEKIVYFCLAGLLFAGTNVLVALGYKSEMISTTKFLNVHPAIWVLLCIALFLFIKGKKPFLMGKSDASECNENCKHPTPILAV